VEKKPFEGIKVLDFTWAGVGPFTVNPLSFFGATVVKLESHQRPDPLRSMGPFKDGVPSPETGYYFAYSQAGKRYNITLNLNVPRGIEIAKRLVRWADVIVDNYATGALEKWGLDYEHVKEIKPDIIMLRSCMFGHTGPLAKHHGQGFILSAQSGFDAIFGWPDRLPAGVLGAFTDYIAPQFNTIALIAALDYRRRTGKGQYIDNAQHESVIQFMTPLLLDYTLNGRDYKADGNHLAYASPHGIYRCQGEERWVAIAVFTDEEWRSFCGVIGSPALARDSRFSTLARRKANEEALDRLVEQWTSQHTAEEVMKLMQASSVAAGVVENGQDQTRDPQLEHYKFFPDGPEHVIMGKVPFNHGPNFRLSKASYEVGRATIIGEHNEYVYTNFLGLTSDELAKLSQDGVI
jgi:benzylsuccinate CoA-transferase BbsF subunit